MYRRYATNQNFNKDPSRQGKPTAGETACVQQFSQKKREEGIHKGDFGKGGNMGNMGKGHGRVSLQNTSLNCQKGSSPSFDAERKASQKGKNLGAESLKRWLPPALYHPETKKILGVFAAEDLLLIALILVLLDSECTEDSLLVYLLFYILISDHIDLPFL